MGSAQGIGPSGYISHNSVEAQINRLEAKIIQVTETRLYRYLGFKKSEIIKNITQLNAIARCPENAHLLDRIQTVFNNTIQPILPQYFKIGELSRAGMTLSNTLKTQQATHKGPAVPTDAPAPQTTSQMPPIKQESTQFPKASVEGSGFQEKYRTTPQYKFTLTIGEKTFQLKGLGARRDGSLEATGAFGRVFFGKDPVTGKDIAVKVVRRRPDQNIEVLKNEARILQKLSAKEHVLGASQVAFDGDYMFVVMDKVKGEELFDRLHSRSRPLDFNSKVSILLDVAKGIKSSHDAGIIHRDLKPENILVDLQGKATLIDFGLARQRPTKSFAGTLEYMAPETLSQRLQSKPVDIYSFGIMMDEMFSGSRLSRELRNNDVSISEMRYARSSSDTNIRQMLTSLGSDCLKYKPSERLTIDGVIARLEAVLQKINS